MIRILNVFRIGEMDSIDFSPPSKKGLRKGGRYIGQNDKYCTEYKENLFLGQFPLLFYHLHSPPSAKTDYPFLPLSYYICRLRKEIIY